MTMVPSFPAGRLGFYADDFTGGTANLANFQRAGLNAIMFLSTPDLDAVSRHAADSDVVGIAGIARSMRPEAMPAEIEPAFRLFAALAMRVIQYKVCSTFDSSPGIGNLATVMECARRLFPSALATIPVVPACPRSGRYTAFANHYARYGGTVHRIDRHPVMSVHPSTPMREADLRRHLKIQGVERVGLVAIDALTRGVEAAERAFLLEAAGSADAVIFDGMTDADVATTAQLIWDLSARQPVMTIAAQDLALHLGRRAATTQARRASRGSLTDVDRMLVFSGSASSQNGAQVSHALQLGWAGIALDPVTLLSEETRRQASERLHAQIDACLSAGRSAIIYTATGPDDPMLGTATDAAKRAGIATDIFSGLIGDAFGDLAARAVRGHRLRRLVFAGGDTSSHAMRRLAAFALTIAGSRASGGNITTLRSDDPEFDGLEVLLKGGQVGAPDIFVKTLTGAEWITQNGTDGS